MEDGALYSAANSSGVITDHYTSEQLRDTADAEGLLDLSESDLLSLGLTEIESLDTDADVIMDDYLDSFMQIAEVTPGLMNS